MSNHTLIYITFPDTAQAQAMAEQLLGQGLVACANIMPAHKSIYKWEDNLVTESEVVMLAKTRKANFAAIKAHVQQEHPYDVPCVLMLDISDANQEFLSWIDKSVK